VVAESEEQNNKARFYQDYGRASLRRERFTTMSGTPLQPVYGEDDGEFPGQYPYTRGIHASMYRSKLWTMRQFAGFGSARDTNARFRQLLGAGGTGLSTAFDMPTLLGRDSDDPLARGEVGRAGVAIDTKADMATLFAGIDLSAVTTSMTINSAAAPVMAMYLAVAEDNGLARSSLGGTLQNDILKEYQAQKEFVFPPRPSVRLVTDLLAFTTAEMPKWHALSISGYHIREAGSSAAQELAFTLANGFAYIEAALARGLAIDDFGPRLSFFFNAHIDFFEEIAKYRAARRIFARWMNERYRATSPKSMTLKFHTQTAGVSLTAQQPELNLARVAIEALAGVLGGTQSLHTDSFDEALALPTEKAARLALRTQQMIAEETGVAHVADPLGGSYFVEALTDTLETQAEEIFAYLLELGHGSMAEGVFEAIEAGWFQNEIADAAYAFQKATVARDFVTVGVDAYVEDDEDEIDILYIDGEVERVQLEQLQQTKTTRDQQRVAEALRRIATDAAVEETNLMPALLEAAHAQCTIGEQMAAMESVFGTWTEPSLK